MLCLLCIFVLLVVCSYFIIICSCVVSYIVFNLLFVLYVCSLVIVCSFFFFFFKQKTAYEMRISDWSSDVCSSDLAGFEPERDACRRKRRDHRRACAGGPDRSGFCAVRPAVRSRAPQALRESRLHHGILRSRKERQETMVLGHRLREPSQGRQLPRAKNETAITVTAHSIVIMCAPRALDPGSVRLGRSEEHTSET